MLSPELEKTLNKAVQQAREKPFEFITVEHLLLALLDDPSTTDVLRALNCNIESLRTDLVEFIDESLPVLAPDSSQETQPTLAFQRVIQRDIQHVHGSVKKEFSGANVLVAIY